MASAQVSLSGDARMGVVYDGDDVRMTSRARVHFTLSGETDGGLAFGAGLSAHNAGAAANGNTNMSAGSVFISGEFGKLSMGDVGSAARSAVGDLHGVGLTGLGSANEYPFLDRLQGVLNDEFDADFNYTTAAMYEYSIDALSVYASVGQLNTLRAGTAKLTSSNVAIGARYDFGDFGVSAGYEMAQLKGTDTGVSETFKADHIVLGVDATFEGINVKAIYGRAGKDLGEALKTAADASRDQYGISMSGSFDAIGVSAFAHRGFDRTTNIGLGASYNLGGGARIVGGVRNENPNVGKSNTTADLGLSFSF